MTATAARLPFPAFRVTSLASGSDGNAYVVEAGGALVVVDAGLGYRAFARSLAGLGRELAEIDAIVVTHEHGDHAKGLPVWGKHIHAPVYLTAATARALGIAENSRVRVVDRDAEIAVGEALVRLVPKPHDGLDPVAVTVCSGGRCAAVITDLGEPTAAIAAAVAGADLLVLESNHDAALLRDGPYPPWLKSRVAGKRGHLSNTQAAALVLEHAAPRLAGLALAHLSETNNEPGIARAAMAAALARRPDLRHVELVVAPHRYPAPSLVLG